MQKFHNYTYGRTTKDTTDHTPLVAINNKPTGKARYRIRNLIIKGQTYDHNIAYKPGKELLLANTLSRSPVGLPENTIHEEINNITISNVNKDVLEKIREDTKNDVITTKLAEIIMKGWPSTNRDFDTELMPWELTWDANRY